MTQPQVRFNETINYGVSLSLKKKGFFSNEYQYELSEDFVEIIRAFTICSYIAKSNQGDAVKNNSRNINELEKALALFMFDSMDEVTEDNLKKQRNALIKAFHPDNNVNNQAYSQKINAAYELLSATI